MTETGFYSLSSADIALLTTVRCKAQAKSSSLPNTALISPNRAVGSLPEWSYKRSTDFRPLKIFSKGIYKAGVLYESFGQSLSKGGYPKCRARWYVLSTH